MTKSQPLQKTHWLKNPNKNFLGHQDLPSGKDIVLTIISAKWEVVTDPVTKEKKEKRVIRFKEDCFKPFICNQTNAEAILKSTKENFMEDCIGKKIKLSVSQAKVAGNTVDCLRVRNIPQEELEDKNISEIQKNELEQLLKETGKDEMEFCKAIKIESISYLPVSKFDKIINRLKEIKNQLNNNENENN